MDKADPFLVIAGRASNLSERARIVKELGLPTCAVPIGKLEEWKIDRLSGKLADKFRQESFRRSVPALYDKDELVDLLTTYERHIQDADAAAEEVGSVLAEVHREWLPTYRAALRRFDDRRTDATEAAWRRFDVYYGSLAKGCEPFLLELDRGITASCEANSDQGGPRFARQFVDDFATHFLARFDLCLAWTVEADGKVHCARSGTDRNEAEQEEYLAYLDSTFADSVAYDRFYRRFPMLGRWLAHVTALLVEYGSALVQRLVVDARSLGNTLFGQEIVEFTSVKLGNSDYHAGGRSVAFVQVALEDGSEQSFVYKPRCIRSEEAMQILLGRLRDDGVLDFVPRTVLPRNGYGYEARIPARHNRMDSLEQVEAVYEELGGYLGIFYIFGGGDLHFENVFIADGHAFICDCETVLGVVPGGQGSEGGTLLDSVFRTGLLEWPQAAPEDPSGTEMRISGYAGGESYELPIPVPRVEGERLTFRRSVAYELGIRVDPNPYNRAFLGERLVQPQDHVDSITRGFERVYHWFEERGETAVEFVSEVFSGTTARFINRSTQIYGQLLISARHPKFLMEPLELDVLTNAMRTFPRKWDKEGVLTECELSSLWRLDVPIFTSDVHSRALVHDHSEQVPLALELSPVEHAAERIGRLSQQNRNQQIQYIAASLSTGEVSSSSFTATSLDYAKRIGWRLCRMLREASDPAPWTAYQLNEDGLSEADVEADLYHGTAGIALFLAYLDDIEPQPEFRAAAERALAHSIETCDHSRLGAFSGTGGLIYLLTHLHHLWKDETLLDRALRLVDQLPERMDKDRHHDVFMGAAGIIPVMLGLADAADGQGLECARHAADRLLRCAEAEGDSLSWPLFAPEDAEANLTGFAHGAGGIGWALIALGARLDQPEYVAAGRRAFAYEARHFDEDEQDWYDLRTSSGGKLGNGRHFANAWCNGAAGIGLSRIASWDALGGDDEELLSESRLALIATLRNFRRLGNDTLCHGACGNAELLLRFSKLVDEPAFQLEANVQVQNQWRNFESGEQGVTENSANFFPGLMLGISGFGMHFLRLAYPDRIPSVLLLDPPR